MGRFAPIEFGKSLNELWQDQFDVNVFGAVRVTREFLPLLRQAVGGRVLLVASIGARMVYYPFASYCVSKFAVRAFADGLRREVAPWGIKVSVIEPFGYRTSILNSKATIDYIEAKWEELDEPLKKILALHDSLELAKESMEASCTFTRTRIHEVVEAMRHPIMTVDCPLAVYRVGGIIDRLILYLMEMLPETAAQLALDSMTRFQIYLMKQPKQKPQ